MRPAVPRPVRDRRAIGRGLCVAYGLFVLLIATVLLPRVSLADSSAVAAVGESIYRLGLVGSGAPLDAIRGDGMHVTGTTAACISCHRRSGLGSKEGLIAIPPITGRYLFSQIGAADNRELPYVDTMRINRKAYTDATLARAIRDGIGPDGKPFGYLMPRFSLDDADMATLIDYLKRLDRQKAPGVADAELHFATVITPDVDPVKRRGMLDVLEHYFADKNALEMAPPPALRSSRKMMFMVHRRWRLHVWELTGPPQSWEAELKQHLAAEPVLAVISGLGGANWEPIQSFCEHEEIPCLFPNVEVPPADAEKGFYSIYFSKGVLLEAELIAKRILEGHVPGIHMKVTQVYRPGDSGEAAARSLAALLRHRGVAVENRPLGSSGERREGVAGVLKGRRSGDALVLWLRPPDIAQIASTPPPASDIYLSGLMGDLEQAPLPAAWRERTLMAYPFDLPKQRRVRVDYPLGWFRIRQIPVVAEQVQVDTYLACGLVAETLSHMADTFVRDYLVERAQDMLEHRIMTGYYPHLALATGQRFASKGGHLVRFADIEGTRIASDQGWLVP